MTLRVKNWKNFQHYKDRNPPWIKLHYELLSGTTWVSLDDASRVLAVACMLIASRHDGEIPTIPGYVKRVAYLNKEPNFKPLIDIGFLELLADASTMLADASDSVSVSVSVSVSEKGGCGGKEKLGLENLSVEHVSKWLSEKREDGKFIHHDEFMILESFKDYCRSKGKVYKDWAAALRGAFLWEKNQPRGKSNGNYGNNTTESNSANFGGRAGNGFGAVGSKSIHQPSRAASDYRKQVISDVVRQRESQGNAGMAETLDAIGQLS